MSIARQKSRTGTGGGSGSDRAVAVVAVKACKEIPRAALTWALTNVALPGDSVSLLVVVPTHTSSSKKLWGFPSFHSDCTAGHWRIMSGTVGEQKEYITDLCNRMMSQLRGVYDPEKVTVKMKVVHECNDGVVASEAKRAQTQWVVLDRQLKKEANFCTEKLDCNVIVVKNLEPKVLQLNLVEPRQTGSNALAHSKSKSKSVKLPNVTPMNSPNQTSSNSGLDKCTSATFMSEPNRKPKVVARISRPSSLDYSFGDSNTDSESEILSSSRSTSICSNLSFSEEGSRHSKPRNALEEIYTSPDSCRNVREMILFKQNVPLDSPPLCSVCHHKTPSFGKPPRMFSYSELANATDGFSEANFFAEGGYGCVHRGVLPEGQVVAVKQLASGKGDREFCSEVGILSCAQHRNVVMLIGYCAEDGRRLLVYEYICNGSLDSHLYGTSKKSLDWGVRQKIAVGAARGLRYLHEECRVGCIVHRDMRPNNILLTHDFEPLVGDFGLARLLAEGQSGEASRIMGTIGYMAPEYAQTGQVCEKADVYSFGVVLVELVTGRKAIDKNRPKGQKCLTEWARPLLEENALSEHVDPCLRSCFPEKEVQAMMHCASLCLQRDPQSRPRMSQVLRMLEGDVLMR